LSVSALLILIAVVVFILAAVGVGFSSVAIVPLGLAFFAAGHLPLP
jgi:hypothetical protein